MSTRVLFMLSFWCMALQSYGAWGQSHDAQAPGRMDRLVANPSAFETLVNPPCSHCVDEAKRRAGELRDDDRVLAWIRGYSQGGGIPLRFFLVPYRVISDTYGVFVYDHEAGYMRGFEPSLDFEFYGWRNGVMAMRHKDGTLYSCLSGRAFDGPRKGHQLQPVPTIATDWGYWLRAYPGAVAYHMFEKYRPVEVPTIEHRQSVASRVPVDGRLPANEPVIGVEYGGTTRAYPIAQLQRSGGLIRGTRLGSQEVVVLWYAPTRTAAVYAAELDVDKNEPKVPVSLRLDASEPSAPFVDAATGSRFDIAGRSVAGPLRGRTLRWLPGVECRWFAWAAEYPQTEIYAGAEGASTAASASTGSDSKRASSSFHGVIVAPDAIRRDAVAAWQRDGYRAVVAVLDEAFEPTLYESAAAACADASLDLYYWIEVARNTRLATEHPQWMASLGMHGDWRRRFPDTPALKEGDVAKAFPWVPIGYRESFDAQLARIGKLLERVAEPYRGVLLNDLQGGPASCGCGNLQCRWAIDYHVPATATKLDSAATAPRFVAAVQQIAKSKTVVPVWTTECEEVDLPDGRRPEPGPGTGLCGGVPCALGTCPKAFSQQWSELVRNRREPVGVLAVHKELDRDGKEYGEAAGWISHAIDYLEGVPRRHGAKVIPRDQLWIVVQGYDVSAADRAAARKRAHEMGAGAVLVALTRIDQSYEPRIVPAK